MSQVSSRHDGQGFMDWVLNVLGMRAKGRERTPGQGILAAAFPCAQVLVQEAA